MKIYIGDIIEIDGMSPYWVLIIISKNMMKWWSFVELPGIFALTNYKNGGEGVDFLTLKSLSVSCVKKVGYKPVSFCKNEDYLEWMGYIRENIKMGQPIMHKSIEV